MTTIIIGNEPEYWADGPPGVFIPLDEADALEAQLAALTAERTQLRAESDSLRAEVERLQCECDVMRAVLNEITTSPEWELEPDTGEQK